MVNVKRSLKEICLHYNFYMTYSKSSTHKVIGLGAAEDPRAGLSLPNERLTENAEALIPMINAQFIDAKVRKNIDMEF